MARTIGIDGKFLWDGKNIGSRSGHGVHARRLLPEMLDSRPEDIFRAYTLDPDVGCAPRPNLELVTLSGFAKSSTLRNLFSYPVELMRRPVDALLAFSTLPAYAPCKTVLLLADVFWLANPGWLPPQIALPRTLATRSSAKRADLILTTTEFSRREITRLLRVPPDKIAVAPHGVRAEFARRLPRQALAAVRDRYGLSAPYILSLNDIHPRKNLEGLLKAFALLKSRVGLPHQLVVGGRSLWPYPEFHRAVRACAFADDVKVLGYVPSEDVLALYQGAELFVYPSFYEGWGLQVHEAMIAGTPVAVANNTTMPEIAGDAAESFDPYDPKAMSRSMEHVLTDPAYKETLIARGLERVKLYSWRRAAEATLAACDRVLA